MGSLSRAVWTIDEYSFVSSGRKVTIPKGERFYELSRPNSRWVLVSRVSDSSNLFLPLKILTEDSLHLLDSKKPPMSQKDAVNMDEASETLTAEKEMNTIGRTKEISSQPDSNVSSILNAPNPTENAESSTCFSVNASTGHSDVIQTEDSDCESLSSPEDFSLPSSGPRISSPYPSSASEVNEKPRSISVPQVSTIRNEAELEANKQFLLQSAAPSTGPTRSVVDKEITINRQPDTPKTVDSVTSASAQSERGPSAPVALTSNLNDIIQEAPSPNGTMTRTANYPIHYCPRLAEHVQPIKEQLPAGTLEASESPVDDANQTSCDRTAKSSMDVKAATSVYSVSNAAGDIPLQDNEPTPKIRANKHNPCALRRSELIASDSASLEQMAHSIASAIKARNSTFYVQPINTGNSSPIMQKGEPGDAGKTKLVNVERRGTVQWKKLKKNTRSSERWSDAHAVLSGHYLLLYKDIKATTPKPNQPLGKYLFRFHIRDLLITDASESETSKKNVLKVEVEDSRGKSTPLLLAFPSSVLESWKIAIGYAQSLVTEGRLSDSPIVSTPGGSTKLDQGVLAKLREFFKRRPTAEDLRGRGILKNEPVFASTLVQICQNESSEVPRFIVRVIEAIEARGLEQRGIYRVAGNAAVVQKLRCAVDQGNYSLDENTWSLEVLTDSLKLFFRELKEPLFITELFPKVKELLEMELPSSEMVVHVIDLINTMPPPHIATARALFHHLNKVMERSDENQMTPENLATVFGPGLLRDDPNANQWLSLVVQVPFVNFCLRHLTDIFPHTDPSVTAAEHSYV